jgi:hypothetical protein
MLIGIIPNVLQAEWLLSHPSEADFNLKASFSVEPTRIFHSTHLPHLSDIKLFSIALPARNLDRLIQARQCKTAVQSA